MKIKTPPRHRYDLFERSRRVRHIARRISHRQPRRTFTAMKFIMGTTSRCFAATVNTTNCRLLSVETNAFKNSRFFRYVKTVPGSFALIVVVGFLWSVWSILIRSFDVPFIRISFSCSVFRVLTCRRWAIVGRSRSFYLKFNTCARFCWEIHKTISSQIKLLCLSLNLFTTQ